MRISNLNAYSSSMSQLQRRQLELSETQERLTSGKRVLKASDDPAAAARAERALASMKRAESQQRALDASRNSLQMSEAALGNAGELLQQVRELVVGAGNGSFSDAERRNNAEAIRSLRNDLLTVANRTDGAGRYLFGGQGSDRTPLVDAPGGVTYQGASGQLSAAVGEDTPLALDGRAVWLQAHDPLNPGTSLSVFDVLDRTVAELLTPGRSSAEIAQTVTDSLGQIDVTAGNLSSWRSRTGEALKRADSIESRLADTKLESQRQRSDAEDLDMINAISDFKARQTGYDAALQTYSLVQRMSLFDYLK